MKHLEDDINEFR